MDVFESLYAVRSLLLWADSIGAAGRGPAMSVAHVPRRRGGWFRRKPRWGRGGFLAWLVLSSACTGEVSAPAGAFSAFDREPVSNGPTSAMSGMNTPDANVGAGPGNAISVTGQALDCKQAKVGVTPLQRLARHHYVHSIRDLLGVEVPPSSLPADEKVGVFDGNTVTPVSDLLVESYMSVAETIAQAALPKLVALVPCDRAKLGDAACAGQFIDAFGERVYRRPLEATEHAAYIAQFSAFKAGGYAEGLRVVVQTMLQSPHFLYRVELTPAQASAGPVQLEAYELAARLSFFLVSTTPDETLLALARSGALLTPDVLAAQAARLVADARFADTVDSFHLQWLDLEGLDGVTKDAALYPSFNVALSTAMRTETLRFANYVLREADAKLTTLLTAPYSFPEGPLVGLYGLQAGATPTGGPVALDPAQRAGLLTQPAFLTAHSHYRQSGPVQRGKVVLRNVLCAALPDPPPNVDTTPPDPSPSATTREQASAHTADPACAGCHKRIDGIGLGFEHFDAIGAFRTVEAGKSIDASGVVLGTSLSDGNFDGVPALAKKLAASPEVQQCVTTQWLRFALGRLESDDDACTIDQLFKGFQGSALDLRQLLQSIVLSDAFRTKRVVDVSTP